MTHPEFARPSAARTASFRDAFSDALRGRPFHMVGLHDEPTPLPAARWAQPADAEDLSMLSLCEGPTLDVGCGPGRMSGAMAVAGRVVLGIDIVDEAVRQTRLRGAPALVRDVFDAVPNEGAWSTALLADGNVGIGGDPLALLLRLRTVLAHGGRVVMELAQPGLEARAAWVELVSPEARSKPFRWAVVGVDDVDSLADRAGYDVLEIHRFGRRWCAVLAARRETKVG